GGLGLAVEDREGDHAEQRQDRDRSDGGGPAQGQRDRRQEHGGDQPRQGDPGLADPHRHSLLGPRKPDRERAGPARCGGGRAGGGRDQQQEERDEALRLGG